MNKKMIFSFLLLLFGEALIIVCFWHFGQNLSSEILILNITVSSIIYLLWFIEKFVPMIDLKDKAQKDVGSLGLKWTFSILYALSAISAMFVFNNVKQVDLTTQIIIQTILFFFLLIGLYFVFYSSQKVLGVFIEETKNRSRIEEMKKATKEVQLKLDQMTNIPADVILKVNELFDNLRFISPTQNPDATILERNYINQIKAVHDCLFDSPFNFDRIMENIKNCERTYKEIKQIYSN